MTTVNFPVDFLYALKSIDVLKALHLNYVTALKLLFNFFYAFYSIDVLTTLHY